MRANRIWIAAVGRSASRLGGVKALSEVRASSHVARPTPLLSQMDDITPSVAEWLENHTFDELALGQTARLLRTLTQQDIQAFAAVSGDTNPTHLDPDRKSVV